MTCTRELLDELARSAEREIKPRLSGFVGAMLRAYLPQQWEFRTDGAVHLLAVGEDGSASVTEGHAPAPDVTLEVSHDRLRELLRTRSRASVPDGALRVTPHTAKGRAAFDLLRSRLGL